MPDRDGCVPETINPFVSSGRSELPAVLYSDSIQAEIRRQKG